MKYARLSISDLKDLEDEFVKFLILNGIAADDWEKLKKEENEKAELIIDQFSDAVWEGILRKTDLLELRRNDFLTLCYTKENLLYTFVIKAPDETIDFTLEKDIEKVLSSSEHYEVTVRKDIITRPVAEQLFDFIKVGFYITKDEAYRRFVESKIN
ncbi:MAG TPA: DUF6495 family protein [Brumimicrobium sp.]|nr:DUF6495 family protein [Brumimicrobium sp.]